MKALCIVVAGLALWACHEQKPRPVTDCGDNCADAGDLDAGAGDSEGAADASDE